jgi:hypothetical protein
MLFRTAGNGEAVTAELAPEVSYSDEATHAGRPSLATFLDYL